MVGKALSALGCKTEVLKLLTGLTGRRVYDVLALK